MHMAVDPEGMAYLAVLSPMNQPVGNLHHMKIPFSEVQRFAGDHAGSIMATGDKGWIKIEATDKVHPLELMLTMHDDDEGYTRESSIRKGDLSELCAMVSATPA